MTICPVEPATIVPNLVNRRFAQIAACYIDLPNATRTVWCIDQMAGATSLNYVEGQLAALARLRHILQSMGEVSMPVAQLVLENELQHWQRIMAHELDEIDIRQARIAYSRGGCDALDSLIEAVDSLINAGAFLVTVSRSWPSKRSVR